MSYIFDGTGDWLDGTLTTGVATSVTCTLACWVKWTYANAEKCVLNIGNTAALNQSQRLSTFTGTELYSAVSRSTGDSRADFSGSGTQFDGIWTPWVGVYTNDHNRDVYVGSIGNTTNDINARNPTAPLTVITIGASVAHTRPITGRIAEVAVWNSALSVGDVTSYIAGVAASGIAAANLIAYYPMSSSDITNLGTDATGDLTASGNAAFDSDHPTITPGLDPIRLVWRM